jgi:error-prone DNA polymerase
VREHGVEVRPADVAQSDWDCTLEGRTTLALRLGLRLVKRMRQAGAQRLMAARRERAFSDIDDLARRAKLQRQDLKALAHAGALQSLTGHRRAAWWAVLGREEERPLLAQSRIEEPAPTLPAPREGEDIRADYQSMALSLRRHPLALLRPHLKQLRLRSAAELQEVDHKRLVRTAGLVITRQRPGTASGVTFVTLEDETGSINVVVWRDLAERQRRVLLGARLMAVVGVWERRGEVCHLIAGRLEDHSTLLGDMNAPSRDFH